MIAGDLIALLDPLNIGRTKPASHTVGDQLEEARRFRPRAGRARTSPSVDAVTPSAFDLLSGVLHRHPEDRLPVVQFLPLGGRECVRLVAAAFAAASAAAYGRTLLLDVSTTSEAGRRQDFGSAPADADALALRRTMTPDIATPGLHYAGANPRCRADLTDLIAKAARSTAAQAAPFKMIVLDETQPLAREHALMLSTACTATVPVAIAGVSRLPEMRETLRRLRAAGANLTGLVLLHAAGDPDTMLRDPAPPRC